MAVKKFLLLVFDAGGVLQGRVHISVTVSIWNALDGLRGSFSEGNAGPGALNENEDQFLLILILLVLGLLFLLDLDARQ